MFLSQLPSKCIPIMNPNWAEFLSTGQKSLAFQKCRKTCAIDAHKLETILHPSAAVHLQKKISSEQCRMLLKQCRKILLQCSRSIVKILLQTLANQCNFCCETIAATEVYTTDFSQLYQQSKAAGSKVQKQGRFFLLLMNSVNSDFSQINSNLAANLQLKLCSNYS